MSFKGFGRHPNGKAHPVHGRKGVSEKDFKIGDEIIFSRIPVGQENKRRFEIQKQIAVDMTPEKNRYPFQRVKDEAITEMNENNPDWGKLKERVDNAELDEWVGNDGSSGMARYYKILNFSDFPVITTSREDPEKYQRAIFEVEKVLDEETKKRLGGNYFVVRDEHDRIFVIGKEDRERIPLNFHGRGIA